MKYCNFILINVLVSLSFGLVVNYNFTSGVKPFSYQTFSGVAMYSKQDISSNIENSESYILLDLEISRNTYDLDGEIELIIIPDTNINDIGIRNEYDYLHLCCTQTMIYKNNCKPDEIDSLMINKDIKGILNSFAQICLCIFVYKYSNDAQICLHVYLYTSTVNDVLINV